MPKSNLKYKYFKLYLCLWIFICSCGEDHTTLFTNISSSSSNITFKNLVRESENFNVLTFGYFYNGGGVAVGDLNNDGLDDIYFTGNMMASHLYLNQGDLKFKEIAESAGVKADGLWNTGVTMVDVNADGWLDIYVCRSAAKLGVRRTNQLFINNHNLTFTESAALYGLDDQGYSTQAVFLDYDRDGDLDMYLLNHSVQEYAGFGRNLPQLKNQINKEYGDRLYENNLFMGAGEMIGRFNDVTPRSGINSTVLGFGLGVAVDDLNNDGWLDIYVSNDYNEEDYLYINQKDGTFKNEVVSILDQSSLFSMGNDIADINNDGLPDIISLDMLPEEHERIQMTSGSDNYVKKQVLYESGFHLQSMRNMLHLNNGDGTFSEIGQYAGIANTDWSWASLIEDYDLDGYNDVFVTNGYKADYTNMDFMTYAADQQIKQQRENKNIAVSDLISKIPSIDVSNFIFKNNGKYQFEDVTEDWGLDKISLSNGAAYADFDNDGDLDLVVNNLNEKASLYRNNAYQVGSKRGTTIKLNGYPENLNGIGSKINLIDARENIIASKRIGTTRGFQSAVAPKALFADTLWKIASHIDVMWPNGISQRIQINTDKKLINIAYDSTKQQGIKEEEITVFSQLNSKAILDYKNEQQVYNDFDKQKLMPFKMSDRGPKISFGDVNGDGLEDVYICGSHNVESKLYLQKADNSFQQENRSLFLNTKESNEMSAVFFDADGDSDLDLYAVCSAYQSNGDTKNNFYINDGSGVFSLTEFTDNVIGSFSTVVADDYDQDGDQDLFIGGYLKSGSFTEASNSKLLLNDGTGKFEIENISFSDDGLSNQILTDGISVDFDQDGDQDLIVVGHWMQITICENDDGSFDCHGVPNSLGLWNTIKSLKYNEDGYPDLVVGNYGLNSQLSASLEQPLKLYYEDFDKNGTTDPVLCKTIGGEEYPYAFRDDLVSQIPSLKKKLSSYADYAKATVSGLIGGVELNDANSKIVQNLSSSVLINSEGKFKLQPLPWQAQQAPIYAIEVCDINSDGIDDILVGGNQLGAMVQIGPNLSNKGTLLVGTKNDGFKATGNAMGSLGIKGEIRDIKQLSDGRFVIARNRDSLIILKTNEKPL